MDDWHDPLQVKAVPNETNLQIQLNGPGLFDLFSVPFQGQTFFYVICPPGYIIPCMKEIDLDR